MTASTIVGDVLVVAGALVFTTAALGILRFPDVYTRISAVGTASGFGIILVVTGALLHQPTVPDVVKIVVIIALQLATTAIGSIAIARSAYLTGTPLRRRHYDELGDAADESEAGQDPPGPP